MTRRLLTFAVALLVGIALGTLTGCTPAQTAFWLRWHHDDPEAAVAFLDTPEGQALLDDTGTDDAQFADYLAMLPTVGDCSSYAPLFERYGLPVATFQRIAWRESGCDHTSYVVDHDDLGGGLLGLNLRAGADRWRQWCGLTTANVTNAETNVRCAAAAYQRMGMAPWA
jgi:hypothetical protein